MTEAMPATVPSGDQRALGETRTWYWVAILAVVTLGFYLWWWSYKSYDELKTHTGRGTGGGVGLVFAIFIPIVNAFLLPSDVRAAVESSGRTSPVNGFWGFWWFLPLVGFFIWTWRTQETLNDYWRSQRA